MARRSLTVMGFASVMVLLCYCSCLCSSSMVAAADAEPAPTPAPAPEPELVPFVVPAPTTYNVGDGSGWGGLTADDPNYWRNWAEPRTFYVGDILQFEYDPQHHNVMQTQGDEGHIMETLCNNDLDDTSITIYSSGKDSVTLDRPGFYSFVSEFDEDCINGLHIVLQVHSTTPLMAHQDRLYRYNPRHYYRPRPYYYYPHYYRPSSPSPDADAAAAAAAAYPLLGMLAIYGLQLLLN